MAVEEAKPQGNVLLVGRRRSDGGRILVEQDDSGNVYIKGDVEIVVALPAGTNAIGKLVANSGVDIGDVDILSIAAGDNNIGNVDIASALPGGTNAIGKLAANTGVDIGDVDVLSIAAGANIIGKVGIDQTTPGTTNRVDVGAALPAGASLIGKVGEPVVVETPFTGSGNVVVGTEKIAPAADFKLLEISLHLSAAPTSGTQNLVITLDSAQGAAYDQVLLTLDLVANAVTDLTIQPNRHFQSSDVITCAWTNTDSRTYGLVFKHQLE